MNQSPIAVVIPTHNRPHLLRRALASVLGQTAPPAEVVVVDDGSEPPVDIGSDSQGSTPIRVVRNTMPSGVAIARNAGAASASADFVAFLDDDDTWVPWKLEAVLKCLETHPDTSVIIHGTGHKPTPPGQAGSCSLVAEPLKRMLYQQPPSPNGVIVRRPLHLESPFDESFAGAEDLDYLIRLAKSGARVAEIDATLAILGDAPDSAVGLEKRIDGRLRLLERHAEILADHRARAFFYFRLGHQYRRAGQRLDALQAFARSFDAVPKPTVSKAVVLTLLPRRVQHIITSSRTRR